MSEGIKVGDFTSRSRILELVFPVGAIYQSFQPKSPAEWLGGTWEMLEEGRTVVAAGGKYAVGSVGGEEEHTLTKDELAEHYHDMFTIEGSTGIIYAKYSAIAAGSTAEEKEGYGGNSARTGKNQPHNNMPPYIAAYIWRRIA